MDKIREVLEERGENYGSFETFANISCDLKRRMRDSKGWSELADPEQEALDMIVHKLSRILNGNPRHHDSWLDIGGYSQLVVDMNYDLGALYRASDELLLSPFLRSIPKEFEKPITSIIVNISDIICGYTGSWEDIVCISKDVADGLEK